MLNWTKAVGKCLMVFVSRFSLMGGIVSQACLYGLTLLITASVVARYFFNSPFLFGDEYGGYLLVWIVFMGLAATLKDDAHIRIDIVTSRISKKARAWLRVITSIASLAGTSVLVWQGWSMVSYSYTYSIKATGPIPTALWIPQMVVPIGAFLLCLQFFATIAQELQSLSGENTAFKQG